MLCHHTSVLNCACTQSHLNKLRNLHAIDAVINDKVTNHCMFDHTAVLPKKWNRKEKMSGGNKTSEELLWYWFVVEALCPCVLLDKEC